MKRPTNTTNREISPATGAGFDKDGPWTPFPVAGMFYLLLTAFVVLLVGSVLAYVL